MTSNVFAAYGHECELDSIDLNDLNVKIPGNSCYIKFKRWLTGMVVTSWDINKLHTRHQRSYSATIKERNRQIDNYPFRIHPYSKARIFWIYFTCVIFFTQIITVPFDCLFYKYQDSFKYSLWWMLFRTIIDLLSYVNVLICMITGYYDEPKQIVVLDYKHIFLHYLKTRLIIDLIVSFPTSWKLFADISDSTEFILQISAMTKYLEVKYYNYLTIIILLFTFAFWHITCCLLLFIRIASHGRDSHNIFSIGSETYLTMINGELNLYISAVYHGSFVIYTAGYGKVAPRNDIDFLAICLTWYISRMFFIFILAQIMQIIKGESSSRYKYVLMEQQLTDYMRQKQFSSYLQNRIISYYHFRFQRRYFNENEINLSLSQQLRQEISMQSCENLVTSVIFFKNLPVNILVRIVSCLKSEIFLVNDVIIRVNTPGTCMYFISSGSVAVYTKTGKEVCHLVDGDFFGEVEMFCNTQVSLASIIAVETCEIYRLDYSNFHKAIKPYPDLFADMQAIAVHRYEENLLMSKHAQTHENLLRTKDMVCHLVGGDFFGEMALLCNTQVSLASIIAVETSEIYRLEYSNFHKVIKPYPDLFAGMQAIAVNRFEQNMLISNNEHKQEKLFRSRGTVGSFI